MAEVKKPRYCVNMALFLKPERVDDFLKVILADREGTLKEPGTDSLLLEDQQQILLYFICMKNLSMQMAWPSTEKHLIMMYGQPSN